MKNFSLIKLEEAIGAVGLAIMTTISFINVITRYVLKYSMAFTEELTLYIFVWITLIGTAIAFREGANMAVTVFYNFFPKGGRKTTILYLRHMHHNFHGTYGILRDTGSVR